MRTPVRLAVVAAGLGAVFAAAVGVGAAVGPVRTPEAHPAAAAPAPEHAATGAGYVLDVLGEQPAAGTATVAFRVLGPDGAPVTEYRQDHGEDLHLVAVRADLSGYQHVHPDRAPDGTWRVPLTLTPGSWRLVADTTPAAAGEDDDTEGIALTADLQVAGTYDPQPLPEPAAVTEVDGYTVVLTGEPTAGAESELTFSVSRDGRPVTDLQPYLGAYGHLVALREGDLEYLHVHPVEDAHVAPAPGPHVAFAATAPSAGTHRLFLDFRHGDAVHTAAFTVQVTGTAADESAAHGHGG
ncbi:hypothetical protein SAMN05660642_01851 [Geodermatophilus siccatus]|uniref:Heavy-metal-associated domain-containing protein n=1 Tax=Geodermatophilus siccatus TaxID=1137991 RepID=A0A1G9RC00_9ACTN|nr:hypothetical protein [Geodermatophilus siccatus]SDM20397.1 hypothetical protein SAMN05660642_01851 [Geodermatophilus siccatus]